MIVEKKEQFIADINTRVNKILSKGGGDEELLMSLPEFMTTDFKSVISSSTDSEIDAYCQKYDGFCRLMKLIEDLAQEISNGNISVP